MFLVDLNGSTAASTGNGERAEKISVTEKLAEFHRKVAGKIVKVCVCVCVCVCVRVCVFSLPLYPCFLSTSPHLPPCHFATVLAIIKPV